MADINVPVKGKRKVQVPRIDLTPMVDLGFLLITFFMYTTTLANPKVMKLNMPSAEHSNEPTVFIAECTITLIPTKDHKIIYYNGELTNAGDLKTITATNVLPLLLQNKQQVASLPGSFSKEAHKLHVIIKPDSDCKYEDVVRMLDDMTIADITYYALTDLSAGEKKWIAK